MAGLDPAMSFSTLPPRIAGPAGGDAKGRPPMKVYEAIADALLAEGCDNLFGLMGDGNMWLWSSLAKKQAKIISARHEAAAVSMADGYSRTTGKVGVAMVTCGPGLTQL